MTGFLPIIGSENQQDQESNDHGKETGDIGKVGDNLTEECNLERDRNHQEGDNKYREFVFHGFLNLYFKIRKPESGKT
jgi:hypothetical protein